MTKLSAADKKVLKAKKNTVTIRMFRAKFGDCFLLAFPARRNKTKYLLIDCGVHHGDPDKKELMNKIADEINMATGGGNLDVVAVTHEHTDHILGFSTATAKFDKMKIDKVWMGWTENYNDPKARDLDKKKNFYLDGLRAAASVVDQYDARFSKRLKAVLGYYDSDRQMLGASSRGQGKRMYNRDTMLWLQRKAKKGPTFCSPGGKPLTIDGVDDVRIYVLGPPMNEKFLKKSSPSRGRKKETYLTDGPTEMFDSFVNGVLSVHGQNNGSGPQDDAVMTPFTKIYGSRSGDSDSDPHASMISYKLYNDAKDEWRRIDNEWMDLAAQLAIKMDSHTNNSSLVLAIELGKNGKVLLFPGDAQVGNWLSWQKLKFEQDDRVITADDLLARTVVYKVSHHGSHNATLKAHGLEKMNNPELTALIPVHGEYADKEQGWQIPYTELVKNLEEKCSNRVLRSDITTKNKLKKPGNLSSAVWAEFKNRVKAPKKYIDYTVKWK